MDFRFGNALDMRPRSLFVHRKIKVPILTKLENIKKGWFWKNDSCWLDSVFLNLLYPDESPFVSSLLSNRKPEMRSLNLYLTAIRKMIFTGSKTRFEICPEKRKMILDTYRKLIDPKFLLTDTSERNKKHERDFIAKERYVQELLQILLELYNIKIERSYDDIDRIGRRNHSIDPYHTVFFYGTEIRKLTQYLEYINFELKSFQENKMVIFEFTPDRDHHIIWPLKLDLKSGEATRTYNLRSAILRKSSHFVSVISENIDKYYYVNIYEDNVISSFSDVTEEGLNIRSKQGASISENGVLFFYFLNEDEPEF